MFGMIKRLIGWTGKYKKRVYIGFIYAFINSIFTSLPIMLATYGLGLVFDDYKGIRTFDNDQIIYIFLLMILVIGGRFLFSYLRAVTQESVGCEATAEQRIRLGNIFKRVSLGFFNSNNMGEISSAVTTDLSFIEMLSMNMINTVVNGYITVLVMILFLLFYCPLAGIISLSGIVLSALFLYIAAKISDKNASIHQKAQDSIVENTIEFLRGMQTIKAFKQEGVSVQGIRKAYKNHKDVNIKIELENCPYNCLHQFVLKAASVGIIAVSAYLTYTRKMDVNIMLMMDMFSFVMFSQIEPLSNAIHVIEVVNKTLDKLEKIEKADIIDKGGQNIELKRHDIKFSDVCFSYDKKQILNNISFYIPEGSTTAIVGPSGSGKTTICNLIARFYDVNSGVITVGDKNIKDITCDSLLKNISMVFQKVYLFNDTIKNNILFGNPNASDNEVINAAIKAHCHEFISKLPNGYDTIIGDGGATLSGGEKQRISIARAILKDSPIIILDEATASVDPENEHLIQNAISSLTKGKTVIVIAHRLATIQDADQILVIDNGDVVQKGNHLELINQDGIYKNFINIKESAEGWCIS
ncbi:TPA: ABC transporter ATP-binding protein [Streptococcus pyogenes]|jgi:ABC transporter, ATP-binding protein|nr:MULTISPECIES: ABC transporter ATP-binding protein [Bacillota]MDS2577070.1 ABC transporter ATP-binding protein [Streptococcus pneumoniae]STO00818.1 Lipid A export ATP-binding/permease protein MsbA [[Eubacterium] infirmum]HEQ9214006.1 ABC transporter ATP-binding protein [Streptococcus pyogenes]HER4812881.1 ABC transporter ATP-binding protein [Streptococcus pyogenes NGAS056]MDS3573870.1 ABC transporter ATP-binding protein [Streptococcus pneumoniae]